MIEDEEVGALSERNDLKNIVLPMLKRRPVPTYMCNKVRRQANTPEAELCQ